MTGASKPSLLHFPNVHHAFGDLTFVDGPNALPFEIRRVFYVHGIPEGARRGGHAHKRGESVLIALAGGFDVKLSDPSGSSHRFRLDDPLQGVHVPPLHWLVIDNYAPDSLCLVLASDLYDEADYIRDHDAFLAWGRDAP